VFFTDTASTMTILKFPQNPTEPPFFKDIREDGYHIFSLKNAKITNYYPNEFSDYPSVPIKELKVGDKVTSESFSGLVQVKIFVLMEAILIWKWNVLRMIVFRL